MWVPRVVVEELEDIMRKECLNVPAEAWHRLVNRSRAVRDRPAWEPPLMEELRGLGRKRKRKARGGGFL